MSRIESYICDFCGQETSIDRLNSVVQLNILKNAPTATIITPFNPDTEIHCCDFCKPSVIKNNQSNK